MNGYGLGREDQLQRGSVGTLQATRRPQLSKVHRMTCREGCFTAQKLRLSQTRENQTKANAEDRRPSFHSHCSEKAANPRFGCSPVSRG